LTNEEIQNFVSNRTDGKPSFILSYYNYFVWCGRTLRFNKSKATIVALSC